MRGHETARTLRKIAAFFGRRSGDCPRTPRSILLATLEALFDVSTMYYLLCFVESPNLTKALPRGSNYFAFALVGFAFFDDLSDP